MCFQFYFGICFKCALLSISSLHSPRCFNQSIAWNCCKFIQTNKSAHKRNDICKLLMVISWTKKTPFELSRQSKTDAEHLSSMVYWLHMHLWVPHTHTKTYFIFSFVLKICFVLFCTMTNELLHHFKVIFIFAYVKWRMWQQSQCV